MYRATGIEGRFVLLGLLLVLVAGGCQSGTGTSLVRTRWTTADAGGARPRDAGHDAPRHDAGRDVLGHDGPAAGPDAALRDAAAGDGGRSDAGNQPDAAPADAGPARCGQLAVSCAPFACDVDAGRCQSSCASDTDCVPGTPCQSGLCGIRDWDICSSNAECASGFCTDGVCCDSACSGPCRSCALPGAIGTCTAVPAGAPDPRGVCPSGQVCGSGAACSAGRCATGPDCGVAFPDAGLPGG